MNASGVVYTFDEGELHILWPYAVKRTGRARESGITNQRKDSGRTDLQIDWMGVLAEYAVARTLGGEPLLYSPDGDRERPDILLPDGTGIEVKATMKRGYNLMVKATGTPENAFVTINGDYLILVWPKSKREVEIVGWYRTSAFRSHAEIRSPGGKGLAAFLPWQKLMPMSLWMKHHTTATT